LHPLAGLIVDFVGRRFVRPYREGVGRNVSAYKRK
jgi:hypothetical protein